MDWPPRAPSIALPQHPPVTGKTGHVDECQHAGQPHACRRDRQFLSSPTQNRVSAQRHRHRAVTCRGWPERPVLQG